MICYIVIIFFVSILNLRFTYYDTQTNFSNFDKSVSMLRKCYVLKKSILV